jgi:hypothetical protein
MKYLCLLLLLFCLNADAQTKKTATTGIEKTIAILPAKFKFIVPYENRKQIVPEQIKEVELRTGFAIQTGIYDWYLKNAKKKKLDVQAQDIKVTNNTLFAGGMSFNEYLQLGEDSLLKILHTDAVWFCSSESSKIVSGGDEGFLSVLGLGSFAGVLSALKPLSITTMKMEIKETDSESAVWKNEYKPFPNDTWGVDKVLKKMLSLAPETFPYKKKK